MPQKDEYLDLEDEKSARKSKKEAELDEDLLPDSGLYTTEGHLFYHTTPAQMTKAQYKRAEEHGINLRSQKNFTLEESVQIFKNWREFAENSNFSKKKALEYMQAKKKKDGHILQHQDEHQFWVKLCNGLPHRSCHRIKARAITMMTDDFLESLGADWDPPSLLEKIRERFYKYENYDEITLQKASRLLERGYASSHVAEILDVPVAKAVNMSAKLRNEERREDQEMLRKFYESAVYYGLDVEKIREHVLDDNEIELDRLRQNVKIQELGFRMHLTSSRCRDLLKTILRKILKTFRETKGAGLTIDEEEAWREAIGEYSQKLPIREEQIYKALEIFCQNATREDTVLTLRHKKQELGKILKTQGITGFQCDQPEFLYLHHRVCYDWLGPLDRELFQNLRRGFRAQLKLHCLLWAYKRMEIWETLKVPEGKTRYEVVLESEMANPLASKMTRKFLKNEKVCEWIMDPRPPKHRRNAATLRSEASVEAFILYTFQKFGGNFKFPKKLRPLVVGTSSGTIQNLLKEILDSENTEYLTMKEVKERVEKASERRISVKIKNKAITVKEDVVEDSESEDVDSEDVVEKLLNHARLINSQKSENFRNEIDTILEKADPSRIRRKFRNREEDVEEIWISEELHRQKMVLEKIAQKSRGKSKEFVTTSDDEDSDSDDEEKKGDPEKGAESSEEDEDVGRNPYEFVTDSDEDSGKEDVKSQNRDSEDPEDPEDVRSQNRDSRDPEDPDDVRNAPEDTRDPEDHPEDVGNSEDHSEDVKKKKDKKKKKRKHQESEVTPEDVTDSRIAEPKKKKKKKRDSDDFPEDVKSSKSQILDSKDPEVPMKSKGHLEDVRDSESESRKKKDKKKKRKHRDPEVAPEDVTMDSEDVPESEEVEKPKKHKKKKKRDSEDVGTLESQISEFQDPEDVTVDSEDVEKPKKHKRKKKRRESEVYE